MEYKSNIEFLKEYADSTNRDIVVDERFYPLKGFRATQKVRRVIYMPNSPENNSFFVWYNDMMSSKYPSLIFSGAFIPLPSKINSTADIRNRYILDRLDIFSKSKANRIGNHKFDSKAISNEILGDDIKNLLFKPNIQNQFLKALKIKSFIHISINEFNLGFIPELENKSTLSIMNRHDWIMDRDIIEKTLENIEMIYKLIT